MEFQTVGNELVVTLSGDLNSQSGPNFQTKVSKKFVDPLTSVKVIMTAVPYMDSTGLGALIAIRKQVISRDGTMTLVNVTDNVRKVLQETQTSILFTLIRE